MLLLILARLLLASLLRLGRGPGAAPAPAAVWRLPPMIPIPRVRPLRPPRQLASPCPLAVQLIALGARTDHRRRLEMPVRVLPTGRPCATRTRVRRYSAVRSRRRHARDSEVERRSRSRPPNARGGISPSQRTEEPGTKQVVPPFLLGRRQARLARWVRMLRRRRTVVGIRREVGLRRVAS